MKARTKALLDRAAKTNRERDAIDGGIHGLPMVVQVSTAASAIAAGVETEDWNCVAEGLEMLMHIENQLRRNR